MKKREKNTSLSLLSSLLFSSLLFSSLFPYLFPYLSSLAPALLSTVGLQPAIATCRFRPLRCCLALSPSVSLSIPLASRLFAPARRGIAPGAPRGSRGTSTATQAGAKAKTGGRRGRRRRREQRLNALPRAVRNRDVLFAREIFKLSSIILVVHLHLLSPPHTVLLPPACAAHRAHPCSASPRRAWQ